MSMIRDRLLFCISLVFAGSLAVAAQKPELVVQTGHSNWVHSVAFSPDGKTLATGGYDNTVVLWDVSTGTELRTFPHAQIVESVCFSPDGKTLATGGADKTIKLWNLSTRTPRTLPVGERVLSLAFSPDGQTLASGEGDNHLIRLWDVSSGAVKRKLEGHVDWVNSVAFSPDGKTLASGSNDRTIRLWDVATGAPKLTLPPQTGEVQSVAFSPDGKTLASSSSDDNATRIWDADTGQPKFSLPGRSPIAFSHDGSTLANTTDGKSITLYDTSTKLPRAPLPGHSDQLLAIAFSPDNKTVASGSKDKTTKLWDVSSLTERRTLKWHARRVHAIALSNDSKTLISGGSDSVIRVWDLSTGAGLRALTGHTKYVLSIALSPDGKTIFSASDDKTIRLWDLQTGAMRAPPIDGLPPLVLSPDGKTLAFVALDGKISLLNLVSSTRPLKAPDTKAPPAEQSQSIVFSPDGNTLAVASDKGIELWNLSTGTLSITLKGTAPIAYSVDGKMLAAGGDDNKITLWNLSSGKPLAPLVGHAAHVRAIAFSADGQRLASGGDDAAIMLWDIPSGGRRELTGHQRSVSSLTFSVDGKWLASGSWDTSVKLWKVESGKEIATLISLDEGDWVVVTPDGQFDASRGAEKLMHYVLNTPERGYEVIAFDQLKLRYYEPGLLQEIFKGESLRDVSAFRDVRLWPDVQEVASSSKNPANTKRTIKLINRGGGIGRVQVFVNEREFIADARDAKLKQDPEVKEALVTFDLTGAPVITGEKPNVKVIAWNYDPQAKDQYKGYISSRGTELAFAPTTKQPARKPELYAIIAGISDYAGDKLDLRFAAKDAEDIAKAINVGGKNLFGVERVHLTLLATGDNPQFLAPTKENFQKAFAAYAQQAKPEDIFFVYLSGHGITLGHGSDTYLYLTKDANTTDTDLLQKDSDVLNRATISSEELRDWFKSVNALKQVLILDTCAAGAVVLKLSSQSRDVQTDAIRVIDQMQDVTGFHVLMGSAADSVSYEATQYGQGLLTYSLLQGIKSGEALEEGGRIDVTRLFQYAANKVPRLALNIGGIQRPEIRSPSGDSKSFALGLISSVADKKEIPLETPKPLILRPVLQNQKLGYDNLKLTPLLRDALREESYATARGRDAAPLVFVDAEEMPDAIIPSGNYTIEGETIRVTLNLVRNDEVLKSFTVEGLLTDLPSLVKKLVADFTAAARP